MHPDFEKPYLLLKHAIYNPKGAHASLPLRDGLDYAIKYFHTIWSSCCLSINVTVDNLNYNQVSFMNYAISNGEYDKLKLALQIGTEITDANIAFAKEKNLDFYNILQKIKAFENLLHGNLSTADIDLINKFTDEDIIIAFSRYTNLKEMRIVEQNKVLEALCIFSNEAIYNAENIKDHISQIAQLIICKSKSDFSYEAVSSGVSDNDNQSSWEHM